MEPSDENGETGSIQDDSMFKVSKMVQSVDGHCLRVMTLNLEATGSEYLSIKLLEKLR